MNSITNDKPNTFSLSFIDIFVKKFFFIYLLNYFFKKNTTSIDFLNKTNEVTQDFNILMNRTIALREVCVDLFDKLRGTADFLNHILELLDQTEEGRELANKIKSLKFDLDKSMQETFNVVDDIQSFIYFN